MLDEVAVKVEWIWAFEEIGDYFGIIQSLEKIRAELTKSERKVKRC